MAEPTKQKAAVAGRTQRAKQVSAAAPSADLDREIDRLSLAQALRDFEVANSRVIDLTQRLISANERADTVQRDLDSLRTEHAVLQARHHEAVTSGAYRLAGRLLLLRSLVRRP